MVLLTKRQAQNLDLATISAGIPGMALMETAANHVAVRVCKTKKDQILVVCGRGNNAGDGLAAARILYNRGMNVRVFLVYGADALAGDAHVNYEVALAADVPFIDKIETADVIVDAIFGIGLYGDIDDDARAAVNRINAMGAYVIAVDVPSGIACDTGGVCGDAVRADETVTFGYGKVGLYTANGRLYAGKVHVCDISLLKSLEETYDYFLTDREICRQRFIDVGENAHKGTMGSAAIIAGSIGMTGAATLCAMGALRSGCGIVKAFIPQNLNAILEVKLTEAMTRPMDCTDHITPEAAEKVIDQINKCSVAVIGPGLSQAGEVAAAVEYLLDNVKNPIILDADGINAVCGNINIIENRKNELILTPHPGEFARLIGRPYQQNEAIPLAREFAMKYGVTLVLKDVVTIVATAQGQVYLNSTGNRGLATGGSGDLLCGVIAALIARGQSPQDSAVLGVYLHGMGADNAAEQAGMDGMLPTDAAMGIAQAFAVI